jgi:site-specific DNA-cytosine methylase
MNVLSLFDGISCGQVALERAGVPVENYYASEIKKNAIKVTMLHYPNTIQLGDVRNINFKDFRGGIDLLIGGSPCQDFSPVKWINHESKGLLGDKSSLFYEYLRALKDIEPKYFLLENVKMKKSCENELNEFLGVKGIHINSNLVSYQNRPRIYWTNIPGASLPEDKKINFQDYKDTDYEYCKQFKVNKTPSRIKMWNNGKGKNSKGACANITNAEKIYCITRKQDRYPNSGLIEFEDFCRYLTRKEIELGQTLPLGYTDILTYNQMQDVCGDGWTVDVIAHIFKGLPKI